MANHSSPRTTKLYDRRSDKTSLHEYEKVAARHNDCLFSGREEGSAPRPPVECPRGRKAALPNPRFRKNPLLTDKT